MPFEEKMTWVSGAVAVVVPLICSVIMIGRLQTTPAVGSSVSATLRGRKPEDEVDRKDERDKSIGRHGDLVGFYVSSAGMVGVLVLTMLEAEYFWIANALYLSFAVAMVVSSVVKLIAYHRGF